jgi:uroporphyrinogen-III synthase
MGTSAEARPPEKRPKVAEIGAFNAGSDISAVAVLRRIACRISEAAPIEDVLGEVVDFVTAVVASDSCFVYVLEGDELVLRASKNSHPEVVNRLKLKVGQGITGWVAEHREPAIISRNAGSDRRFKLFNELPEDRFETFLSVPITSRGRLVGIINLQNREAHDYGEREIGLVAMIGFLVGAEIEMARLEQQNAHLTERLESRALVERAKLILQNELGLTEGDAHQKLQRQSQQMRKPMKEIAEAIIVSHAVKSGTRS